MWMIFWRKRRCKGGDVIPERIGSLCPSFAVFKAVWQYRTLLLLIHQPDIR